MNMTAPAQMMTLAQALQWLSKAQLIGDPQTPISRVHSDTRTVEAGDLFVALEGEKFNANHFLLDAKQRGASAVLCRAGLPASMYPEGLARIEVQDTKQALGALAKGWRSQFDIPLIAVTGSNGKTTVTQMLAAILHAHAPEGAALATQGNLNNDIGVPLTLLRMRAKHRIAVVELGMNHPGEIAGLAAMAQPTVALVNNAQREHLEFMHTVEAVAQENGAVISALGPQGIAVFPHDDAFVATWHALAQVRRSFGFSQDAIPGKETLSCSQAHWSQGAWDVHAHGKLGGQNLDLHYRLAIAGRHNVKNSLAAATCAMAAGIPAPTIVAGLETFTPVKGRSRALYLRHAQHDITLIDDTYNANPDSVRAAIAVLADLPAPQLLVLGDMGEVGDLGPQFHTEAASYAHSQGIEMLFGLGALSQHAVAGFVHAGGRAQHFESIEELIAEVKKLLPSVSSVLVKGSRFMRLERVVEALLCADAFASKPLLGSEVRHAA